MNLPNVLTKLIEQATNLIQNNADRVIGNMTIDKALQTIERLQEIRDREAVYSKQRACNSCIKKALKKSPKE